jgi:hypothetical protein
MPQVCCGRMLGACQRDRHRSPEDPDPKQIRPEGRPEMTTLKHTARYARYLLTSLATVAFGIPLNN